jgi:hypothetical protein
MISEEVITSSKKLKLHPRPTDLEDLDDLNAPKKKTSSKKLLDKDNLNSTPNRVEQSSDLTKASKKLVTTKSKPRCRVRSDLKSKTPKVEPKATESASVTEINIKQQEAKAGDEESYLSTATVNINELPNEKVENDTLVADVTPNDEPDVIPNVEPDDQEPLVKEIALEGRPIELIEHRQEEPIKEENFHQGQQEHQEDKVQCDGDKENPCEGEKIETCTIVQIPEESKINSEENNSNFYLNFSG